MRIYLLKLSKKDTEIKKYCGGRGCYKLFTPAAHFGYEQDWGLGFVSKSCGYIASGKAGAVTQFSEGKLPKPKQLLGDRSHYHNSSKVLDGKRNTKFKWVYA